MKKFKLTSSANGKVFRSGLYSTAILAAAIVLAVLVNLLAGAIPSKYTEFDLSAAKMYTLGDSSRQLMQSLDQDVTVYYLCETGSEDAIVHKTKNFTYIRIDSLCTGHIRITSGSAEGASKFCTEEPVKDCN